MPTFSISTHVLLNDKAKDLVENDIDVFNANVDIAEALHNLAGATLTGSKATQAELVLVYQVNLQIEKDQYSEAYTRVKEGDREYDFSNVIVSEMAKTLRDQLYEDTQTEAIEKNKRGASRSRRNIAVW